MCSESRTRRRRRNLGQSFLWKKTPRGLKRVAPAAPQSASGYGQGAMDKLAPKGRSGTIQRQRRQGRMCRCSGFLVLFWKKQQHLGVISHLHLRRDCDRDAEVTGSGVVGIQAPMDGVWCLCFCRVAGLRCALEAAKVGQWDRAAGMGRGYPAQS